MNDNESAFGGRPRSLKSVFFDQYRHLGLVALVLLIFGAFTHALGELSDQSIFEAMLPFVIFAGKIFVVELAFAIIIAIIIAALFERAAREEMNREINKKITDIEDCSFKSLVRAMIPRELASEIIDQIKNIRFIREDFCVNYTLEDDQINENGEKFIKVVSEINFKLTNISKSKKHHRFMIRLPDPIVSDMRDHVDVVSYSVDGNERVTKERARSFRNLINSNNDDQVPYDLGSEEINAGQTIRVCAKYIMAKEVEDTEVLTSSYCADGLRVSVRDSTSDNLGLHINAGIIGNATLQPFSATGGRTANWEVDGWLLPNQGFKLWWKNKTRRQVAALEDAA